MEAYFVSLVEALLPFLGDRPTASAVTETVHKIVELFQKLRAPAKRSLIGFAGELVAIHASENAVSAVRAWRTDPDERVDFATATVRLDMKSAGTRQRVHEISFDQANPPAGTIGIIGSTWIEPLAGGISISQLLSNIEDRLQNDSQAVMRLRTIVAGTLGDSLPNAADWSFDLELAKASLCYFKSDDIPAIRPPLPPGVSSARFVSDLNGCSPLDLATFKKQLSDAERGLLPG
jgi:hypothetical protein